MNAKSANKNFQKSIENKIYIRTLKDQPNNYSNWQVEL